MVNVVYFNHLHWTYVLKGHSSQRILPFTFISNEEFQITVKSSVLRVVS